MKELYLISGSLLALLAVIFGAFGAHALKKTVSEELLKSFETGVKYQMYHALALLFLGSTLSFDSTLTQLTGSFILLGTLLFSFSIYGLCLSSARGKKLRFLGPVTPIGGLLLVIGWICLVFHFFQNLTL